MLVDSEILSARTTTEILAAYGIELSQDYGARHEDALTRLFVEELCEIEGVRKILEICPAPVCVTSNSTHSRLALTLKTTDLLRYFWRNVFRAEDMAAPKPAPDLFRHAAGVFGVDPSHCIAIDDSVFGIAGHGRQARVPSDSVAAATPPAVRPRNC